MTIYNKFYRFYDIIMGDREKSSQDILSFIREHVPEAKKVLELACGTWSVLRFLSEKYETHGLDISEWMLQIAATKVPKVKLYKQSMVDFSINEKFDAIVCVFDSINHLLNFWDWKKVFMCAKKHLQQGGVFIVDMNTQEKLVRTIKESPWIKSFDHNVMIMDVSDAGDGISNWNIKVFEKKEDTLYELHEENICEISFPVEQVENELKIVFDIVVLKEKFRKSPEDYLQSVYFICQ